MVTPTRTFGVGDSAEQTLNRDIQRADEKVAEYLALFQRTHSIRHSIWCRWATYRADKLRMHYVLRFGHYTPGQPANTAEML